ncbi:hypothetical protein BHM03_00055526 [Ensete ventricosum]|nr:hypothetical protein BHM03_00055526 [Ensete ventricosum]
MEMLRVFAVWGGITDTGFGVIDSGDHINYSYQPGLARGLLDTERELVRMSGDSELDLGGRLLEWWSPGEEGVLQSFYSGCCRSFVPDNLTAFMAYHVVVPSHHACYPCNEACVCRWGVPTLPVSGRLYDHWRPPYIRPVTHVRSATLAGQLSEGVMT